MGMIGTGMRGVDTGVSQPAACRSPKVDLDLLAARIEARFPTLSDRGRRVSIAVHRALAYGHPVPDYAIAATARLDISEVREEMVGWPGVYRNEAGRIVGFWGLGLDETAHSFEVDGRKLYAWCAWDTLFLPQILGKAAVVRSHSAVTGVPITLEVGPDAVTRSDSRVVVSFVDPEQCNVDGDRVISTFCHHILFFSSQAEGAAWAAEREDGTLILSLDEAFALGRVCNALRYGDALIHDKGGRPNADALDPSLYRPVPYPEVLVP